ncbi:IPT/TIG domain-containing protein [bacterium]|nr:IPT/TIG domain-containing protein [bacterium]
MQRVQWVKVFLLICPLLLFMFSCEYEGPDALWDPDYNMGPTPVIDSVSPADRAVSGVPYIVLNGQNFSVNPADNCVYFGSVKVDVAQASPTQLKVYRPNLVADNFTIRVTVPGAVAYADFSPYAVDDFGGLYTQVKGVGKANAIAMDADGTILVHVDKKDLYKVLDNGDLELVIDNTKPRIVYDMKVAPDGAILFSRDQNYLNRVMPPDGEFENYANGTPGKMKYFDFDSNGNIYAGGENAGLILIKPDGTFEGLGGYEDSDVLSIRVFNNEVYVAAAYLGEEAGIPAAGVWKHAILSAEGAVGPKVQVLDWTITGDFVSTNIKDITFDVNGVMYVVTDGGEDMSLDPVLMMNPDGSFDTFYKGGLLGGSIVDIIWGSDTSLYYLRDIGDLNLYEIHRIGMSSPGAPEFGRQ